MIVGVYHGHIRPNWIQIFIHQGGKYIIMPVKRKKATKKRVAKRKVAKKPAKRKAAPKKKRKAARRK